MTRRKSPAHADNAKGWEPFDKSGVIDRGKPDECLTLSERDSRRVEALLENPPSACAKLRAAAADLP